MPSYSISEINNIIKGELIGNTDKKIEGPEELRKANNNQITFIGSKKHEACEESIKKASVLL